MLPSKSVIEVGTPNDVVGDRLGGSTSRAAAARAVETYGSVIEVTSPSAL